MKIGYLVTIAVLLSTSTFAKTEKADRLYDQWEYFRAAKLYQIESIKHPGADVYFKLGECYRKMHLSEEAQAAYDKVNDYGTYSKPEFYLNYGQVLKSNGKNEQAKIAFDKYTELVPADLRGKFFSESINIVAEDHKWDEPVSVNNVALLNTQNADLCPVIYKDGIVFTSNRKTPGRDKIYGWTGANYLDLYYAQKGNSNLSFTQVNTFGDKNIIRKFSDGPACFSKDFNTIYVSRVDKDLIGTKKATLKIERIKIFSSTMTGTKWSEAVPFYLNNDLYSVANPFLTSDGSRLYFVSDMPGGYGETDIYYCNRENDGWGAPINMGPNVNTFNREKYPFVDANGNFYFSSDGYQGFGGLDICVAINKNGVLARAIPMKAPFNSPSDDFGIMFLQDGKAGYITSNRHAAGLGDDDIFYFNLLNDKVDTILVTSLYTIGYRRKAKEVITVPTIASRPITTIKVPLRNDVLIYFDLDKSYIRSDALIHLDTVIRYMNEFPATTLLLTGHCDCRGTSNYNTKLAMRRSNAVLLYLKAKGISASRMTTKGYEIDRLPDQCMNGVYYSEPEHQLNRRVYCHFQEHSN